MPEKNRIESLCGRRIFMLVSQSPIEQNCERDRGNVFVIIFVFRVFAFFFRCYIIRSGDRESLFSFHFGRSRIYLAGVCVPRTWWLNAPNIIEKCQSSFQFIDWRLFVIVFFSMYTFGIQTCLFLIVPFLRLWINTHWNMCLSINRNGKYNNYDCGNGIENGHFDRMCTLQILGKRHISTMRSLWPYAMLKITQHLNELSGN